MTDATDTTTPGDAPRGWTVDTTEDPPHLIAPDGHRMMRDDFDIFDEDYEALAAAVAVAAAVGVPSPPEPDSGAARVTVDEDGDIIVGDPERMASDGDMAIHVYGEEGMTRREAVAILAAALAAAPSPPPEAAAPSGMTAEKLEAIAGWLDTYDRLAAQYVRTLAANGVGSEEQRAATLAASSAKDVQDDLRAWASSLRAAEGVAAGDTEQGDEPCT